MALTFLVWRDRLLDSAGSASPAVKEVLGDFVLEYVWRDGCEPTMAGLLQYVQNGLHPAYEARRQDRQHSAALPAPPP
jgi:hypothetical protein